MCNRNQCRSCGCGCQRSCGNGRNYEGCGYRQYEDDAAWCEAERMMREIEMRRRREDRCARQFVRCLECDY